MSQDINKAFKTVDKVLSNIKSSNIKNLNPRGMSLLSKVLEVLKSKSRDEKQKAGQNTNGKDFTKERW